MWPTKFIDICVISGSHFSYVGNYWNYIIHLFLRGHCLLLYHYKSLATCMNLTASQSWEQKLIQDWTDMSIFSSSLRTVLSLYSKNTYSITNFFSYTLKTQGKQGDYWSCLEFLAYICLVTHIGLYFGATLCILAFETSSSLFIRSFFFFLLHIFSFHCFCFLIVSLFWEFLFF